MTKHQAEKLFSFANWASDHPSDPVPGDRIDIQFDNHRRAILTLAGEIENLLRSDGKLNHNLITPESLPRQITSGLIHRTKQDIDAHLKPALARTHNEQRRLESTQLNLISQLHEIKARQHETQALLDRVQELSQAVQSSTRNALSRISSALKTNALLLAAQARDAKADVTAEKWAEVSTVWAEYMDGNATIPPNILATNGITGDHWSSRWWANRAASAFGQMAWWYQGSSAGPPPSTPNDPTGQPLPPGAIYWDTLTDKMMVWDGDEWVDASTGSPENIGVIISPSPPVTPKVGDLWWDSTGGQLYIRYDDVDTQQWVAVVNEVGTYFPLTGGAVNGPVDLLTQVVTGAGAVTINRVSGENVILVFNSNITSMTVVGWPANGVTGKLRLQINCTGGTTIAWPANTIWPGGAPPVISATGKKDIVLLMTDNAGATVFGSIVGQDYR